MKTLILIVLFALSIVTDLFIAVWWWRKWKFRTMLETKESIPIAIAQIISMAAIAAIVLVSVLMK